MRFSHAFLAAAFVILAAWTAPDPARADGAGPWAENDYGALRLITAEDAVGSSGALRLGVEFQMKKGWKIYWRSPGDAGFPPRFDWSASENLAEAVVRWPAPERFSAVGFETMGYGGEVVLPVEALAIQPARPATVRARVEYLTCEEICVPVEADLVLALPAGPAEPTAEAHQIARYAARVPATGGGAGMDVESIALAAGAKPRLVVEASSQVPFVAPDLFVEGPRELVFSPPQVTFSDGKRRARLVVEVDGLTYLPSPLTGQAVTATLVDGERAAERTLEVGTAPAALAFADEAMPTLLAVLGFALLGGLILNLMPCVLPVLAIKLIGIVGQGGRSRTQVRFGFLASAAGILFSFAILAGTLVVLQAAGAAIGWGIQFQQPWFLVIMITVVTAFACNLWGFFTIPLPAWLGTAADAAPTRGLGGHFASGAFATLLATPCSAPFLGTAVGFALARGPAEIAAVFAAVGTGLALPYLAVAAFPALAGRLPRPGPWMVTLRRVLGVALAGTVLWLLNVLAVQAGILAAVIVGGCVAVLATALFLRCRLAGRYELATKSLATLSVLLAFAAPAFPPFVSVASPPPAGFWTPFDEAAIPRLVAEGKVVFVDVTAEWCITCKINKKVALGTADILARLTGDGVVAMQADWTRPDPAISRYLARYGRYGIPFNIVYGPAAPEGVRLPELLTPSAVRDALDASTRPSS